LPILHYSQNTSPYFCGKITNAVLFFSTVASVVLNKKGHFLCKENALFSIEFFIIA
jgi:hypothetical protein